MSRRLLIVDAKATNRIGLKALLRAARYEPDACASGLDGLSALYDVPPDAIIVDQTLPDMDVATFCRRARAILGDATPPILALMTDGDPATRLEVLRAGADSLIARPVERAWLLTHLRALLRAWETRAELRRRSQTAAQIGFVEDSTDFARPARVAVLGSNGRATQRLARKLRAGTEHDIHTLTPEAALGLGGHDLPVPEVYLLGLGASPDDDLNLLSELRAHTESKRAAILVQYVDENDDFGARALDQGANDLFRLDAEIAEIALRTERQLKLKRQSDALRASVEAGLMLAAHDPLTGLFNRRYATHYLADLAAVRIDTGPPYAVLVLDIDHFKNINDTLGHAAGDAVLAQVARRLGENLREGDLLARIGGEEFLVVLPSATNEDAAAAAERLRKAIAAVPFSCPNGGPIDVTLSVGLARGTCEPDDMIARADAALYRAKESGRDRVEVAPLEAATGTESGGRAQHPNVITHLRHGSGHI